MSTTSVFTLSLQLLTSTAGAPPNPATAGDVARATALEDEAFAAADKGQWCAAMQLFLDADRAAPAPALVENAAQSAEKAGDAARAMLLWERVRTLPGVDDTTRARAQERLAALRGLPPSTTPGCAAAPVAPSASVVTTAPATTAAPLPPTTAATPHDSAPPAAHDASLWWVVGGATGVVVGTVGLALGSQPYFAHEAAVAQLQRAEQTHADVGNLPTTQAQTREAWESWGWPVTLGSAVVVVASASCAGLGAWWMAQQDVQPQETR